MQIITKMLNPLSRTQKEDDTKEFNKLRDYFMSDENHEVEQNGDDSFWIYPNSGNLSFLVNLNHIGYSTLTVIKR